MNKVEDEQKLLGTKVRAQVESLQIGPLQRKSEEETGCRRPGSGAEQDNVPAPNEGQARILTARHVAPRSAR